MASSTLPLLVLVALGTLGTAGYLAFSGGEESSAPPTLDPGRPLDPVSQPDRLDAGEADLVPGAGRDLEAGATTGRTQVDLGTDKPTRPRTPGAGGTLLVEVVRAYGDKPMVAARVTFLDRSAHKGWETAWQTPAGRQTLLQEHGQMFSADAAGILRVPRTSSGALLADSRGQHGELEWNEMPQDTLRLLLSPPTPLQVQLIDGAGNPIPDAMVVLTAERDGVRKTERQSRAKGSTSIALFQRVRASYGSLGPEAQLRIEPGFPCPGDPHLKIDAYALPTEVQRLVVGDTGSLKIRVTDERGRPLEEMATVTLGRLAGGTEDRAFEGLHGSRLMGGNATFENLGLGMTVALRLEGNAERAPQVFEVPGPTSPGQIAEARLDWTLLYPVLVARAIDQSGNVLRNRGGTFLLHQGGQSAGGSPVRTDTRGEVRIVIQNPGAGTGTRELEVRLRSAVTEPPMEARRELTRPLTGGEYDLGDLVFDSPPALVSGLVRDARGRPLFGASVRIQVGDGSRAGVAERSTRTDSRGRFTVYGTCDADVVTVVVAHPGFITLRRKNVRPGTSDLRLTLAAGGGQ